MFLCFSSFEQLNFGESQDGKGNKYIIPPDNSSKKLIFGQNQVDTFAFQKYQQCVRVTEVTDTVNLFSQAAHPLLLYLQIFKNYILPLSKIYLFRHSPQFQLKKTSKFLILFLTEFFKKKTNKLFHRFIYKTDAYVCCSSWEKNTRSP